MMCPAEIFANSLIIKANGFVNIPTISIGIMIGIKANGTPGGLKICPQYVLFPERLVTIKVMKDKTRVTAILPVKFAAAGIRPKRLLTSIKKNSVSKYGTYFL